MTPPRRHAAAVKFVIFPWAIHSVSTFRVYRRRQQIDVSQGEHEGRSAIEGERTTVSDGSQLAIVPRGPLDGAAVTWARSHHPAPQRFPAPGARVRDPRDRATLLQATAEARTALEDAVVAAAVAAQRARSLTVALEEALADLAPANGSAARLAPSVPEFREDPTGALSPREKEVLALVAEGRSNKAIAEALYVSPNTVKTHVASLLNKLHADSRVQLAAIAARQFAF
jgi:DNA-binding CsgD family transcriptional regulator